MIDALIELVGLPDISHPIDCAVAFAVVGSMALAAWIIWRNRNK